MTNYIRVEKELLTKGIKGKALNLYLMMLDRASVSEKNNWKTADGYIYIMMKIKEIMEKLDISKRAALYLLSTLEKAALITRIKQGFGKSSLIIVNYSIPRTSNISLRDNSVNMYCTKKSEKSLDSADFYEDWWDNFLASEIKNANICTQDIETDTNMVSERNHKNSASMSKFKKKDDECKKTYFMGANFCTHNNNKYKNIYDNLSMDYVNEFKDKIDYAYNKNDNFFKLAVNTIRDIVTSRRKNYLIQGITLSKIDLLNRFLKLDASHIEYIRECISKLTVPIRNIKAYMITCLYNAPDTIEAYYQVYAAASANSNNQAKKYSAFCDFSQTDMSEKLTEMEELFLREINSNIVKVV